MTVELLASRGVACQAAQAEPWRVALVATGFGTGMQGRLRRLDALWATAARWEVRA